MGRLMAAAQQITRLGQALSVSVLNQAVSSATNFALSIYLVRMLSPVDFGLYGIGFAASLFLYGFGHALFLTQMTVHLPDKALEEVPLYNARMLIAVLVVGLVTLGALIVVVHVWTVLFPSMAGYFNYCVAVTAAGVTYLLKDFFVRHAYNQRKEWWALLVNSAVACAMILMLIVMHFVGAALSVEVALWVYTGSQIVGAISGYVVAELPIRSVKWAFVRTDMSEAWNGGKWATATNVVYFLRTQAHTLFVAGLIGPAGVGSLNAARLFVTPAAMLIPAVGQVAMPRLATARKRGMGDLIKTARLTTSVLVGFAVFYSLSVLMCYDSISTKILGESYQGLFLATAMWCVYTCLLSLRSSVEMIGQVVRIFRSITFVNTCAAIVVLVSGYFLTAFYGLYGAQWALVIGELGLVFLLFHALKPFRVAVPVC